VWTLLRTPNRMLWRVVSLTLLLLLTALHLPWALEVLRFAPLQAADLARAGLLGLLSVLWFETIKGLGRWRTVQTAKR